MPCLLSDAQLLLSDSIDLWGSKSRTLLFAIVFETEASRSCRLNPSSRWGVGTGLCSSSPLPRFHFETTCARVEDVGHTIYQRVQKDRGRRIKSITPRCRSERSL